MAKAVRGPSMFDVARLAGVSHQTVSRVLNEHPNVKDTTRARVRSAIEQLGYRPNRAARTLVTGRDQVLGIVAPRSTLFGPVSLLAAFEEQAGVAGFGISVVRVREHVAGQVTEAVTKLLDARVAGVVVIAPVADVAGALDEVSGDVPLVTVDGDPADDRPMATVDQELGARLATEHLLAAGHRTVWHVGGPTDWFDATGRARGWAAALRDAGIEPPPIVPGDWSPDAGYQAGQFLGRMPEVTAVFTANDGLATGLLHALHDLGRDVPGEVSVVGFDDVPASAHLVPPLTTLRPDFEAVAREALDLLLSDPDDEGAVGLHRHVAPVLVPRASVAAPPSAS
ncbi:LacI family DNA-binding transcriptional regulator [Actinomycetospora sp. CA-084318]|uniref:LacI family DNA-binding transcriptional regulator n=1 Tax=Actinomycetospora sp. CA-084318 TaxID=3239892 RepID=UPI003D962173